MCGSCITDNFFGDFKSAYQSINHSNRTLTYLLGEANTSFLEEVTDPNEKRYHLKSDERLKREHRINRVVQSIILGLKVVGIAGVCAGIVASCIPMPPVALLGVSAGLFVSSSLILSSFVVNFIWNNNILFQRDYLDRYSAESMCKKIRNELSSLQFATDENVKNSLLKFKSWQTTCVNNGIITLEDSNQFSISVKNYFNQPTDEIMDELKATAISIYEKLPF